MIILIFYLNDNLKNKFIEITEIQLGWIYITICLIIIMVYLAIGILLNIKFMVKIAKKI